MKIHNKSQRRKSLIILVVPMLLALGMLGACSNDPVAPHEDPPALTSSEVASQAGYVAMAASIIGPRTVEFTDKAEANPYRYPMVSPVSGAVYLAYFLGGPTGTPVVPDAADYVNLYTAPNEPIVITVGIAGAQGTVVLTLDIEADLDRVSDPDNATINGGGTFVSGIYSASFVFSNLLVEKGADYPLSGGMTFTSAGFTATATFDGDNTALLELSDGTSYTVNLVDGSKVPVPTMLLPE